ncbi:hypothetical protein AX769_05370 [Frondihabitans sp. PAMC 28766]|uniref:hypothetical protein n=1 Tax=Frondihabitans sp. PAMC 28766 TaxID=1795630 RepID=UPI00078DAC6F|nr:hypothetical protein [Frondihabitans sp. PAMC 28766]AMM19676.1 hypothetical protein AX769_05370 [Frondihabitans sp. PAMC 28766]
MKSSIIIVLSAALAIAGTYALAGFGDSEPISAIRAASPALVAVPAFVVMAVKRRDRRRVADPEASAGE